GKSVPGAVEVLDVEAGRRPALRMRRPAVTQIERVNPVADFRLEDLKLFRLRAAPANDTHRHYELRKLRVCRYPPSTLLVSLVEGRRGVDAVPKTVLSEGVVTERLPVLVDPGKPVNRFMPKPLQVYEVLIDGLHV